MYLITKCKKNAFYLLFVAVTSTFTGNFFGYDSDVARREKQIVHKFNKNEFFIYLNLNFECKISFDTFKGNKLLLECAKCTQNLFLRKLKHKYEKKSPKYN